MAKLFKTWKLPICVVFFGDVDDLSIANFGYN